MNDPHEGGERLPNCAKNSADEHFLAVLNDYLAGFDCGESPGSGVGADIPVIYIVGAPRSGTTLLSQVVSRYLSLGYINNLIARFWLKPSVGIRLSQMMLGENSRTGIEFASRHGVTDGLAGPHEFGYFWAHWLRLHEAKTHHLDAEELGKLDVKGMKRALEDEILSVFGQPVVFKNVICGFQAPLLAQLHKKTLFIHIRRELRDTAASILKSRFERYGSYATWWSLKPSTYSELPVDPVEQVLRQVLDCRQELDEKIMASGASVLQVDYKDVCLQPNQVLMRICDCIRELGWDLQTCSDVPSLTPAGCPRLPEELLTRLAAIVSIGANP